MTSLASFEVGDVSITQVIENRTQMPADFLPDASQAGLSRHGGWLQPWALSDDGQLRFVIQALCLEHNGQKIIVDTCVGPRQLPEIYAWVANDGSFISSLADAGFGPDDVDLVICTHLHFDHIGWNTVLRDGRWVPTFPRARYLVVRREYEAWQASSDEIKEASSVFNLDDAVAPLFEAGVVDLVEADHKIGATLQYVSTPGHSPGHVSIEVASQGERALITGDCVHHPVQLLEPDWYTVADYDPDRSSSTRKWLVDTYADSGVLLIGTHFPPPSAGHLVTTNGKVNFRLASGYQSG